jgi:hypothetical protein
VSRYSEQPAYGPEPTTSALPNGVDAADTVAGPVGVLASRSAQELPWALAVELNRRAPAARPKVSAVVATARPAMGLASRPNNVVMMTSYRCRGAAEPSYTEPVPRWHSGGSCTEQMRRREPPRPFLI